MLTEYAGWQISDDKQREIERNLVKMELLAAARANGGVQPAWLRVQLHWLGVRLERFGEGLQLQAEQCCENLAEDARVTVSG
jgi:hypothetical protein